MRYWRALRREHHGGDSHNVASRPAGVLNLGDGMAGHAGDAIIVKAAVYFGTFSERAGKQGDRVMASFAMARVLDPLGVYQHVHVLHIERISERISVRRLS